MCEIRRAKRELRFLDEKVFIKACRILYEHQQMEFFEEQDKKY
jgi:hypothetical protein